MPDALQGQRTAPPQDPPGTLQGPQLARVRQGTPAARQPHGLGHAGGARGLAPAPEDWSEGASARLLGRGDRDRTPAAPGLWSALAANRRSAALTHDPARGEPRGAGPHHVFPAQPGPGACNSASWAGRLTGVTAAFWPAPLLVPESGQRGPRGTVDVD